MGNVPKKKHALSMLYNEVYKKHYIYLKCHSYINK